MFSKLSNKSLLYLVILCWIIINLTQGFFTQLHPDEAYYWLFSKQLSWGYFDHPPMIALWVKIASLFFKGELGVRLLVILSSAVSVLILCKLSIDLNIKIHTFLFVIFSFLMVHTYGFIATPDAPLFLFACLFYVYFFKYLETDSVPNALILGLVSAALLYSKYHGALLILLCVGSNLYLFKRKSLWIGLAFAFCLFLPHIYWQYINNFPSFQYHFIDRSALPYTINNTTSFISNQWLILGPLTSLIVFYAAYKQKGTTNKIRTLKVNFWGIMIFFLLSSFKGWVEAHWTFIAIIPATLLTGLYLQAHERVLKAFKRLSLISILLYGLIRVLFIFPTSHTSKIYIFREFFWNKEWAQSIRKFAQNRPVIFEDKFQSPSLYKFYNNNEVEAYAVNSWYYRKNQFNIWNHNQELRNRPVYACTVKLAEYAEDSIKTLKGTFLGTSIDRFNTFPNLVLSISNTQLNGKSCSIHKDTLTLVNTNNFQIELDTLGMMKHYIGYTFKKNTEHFGTKLGSKLISLKLEPHASIKLPIVIEFPEEKGEYMLYLGIQSIPFMPLTNSKPILVHVQ